MLLLGTLVKPVILLTKINISLSIIYKMKEIYEKYGLTPVRSRLAKNKSEATKIAKKIGFPVVLKIESPDIFHKTDIGGVKLNLYSDIEVEKAYSEILEAVKSRKPDSKISGILVQEMFTDCFELILGYNNDPVFGPTIMIGVGGIFTEVFRDVSFRMLPITKHDAKCMIEELKFSDILLVGYRGVTGVSKQMLSDLIVNTGKMAMGLFPEIESFDINPIAVKGSEHRVIDFKYVPSKKINEIKEEKAKLSYLDNFFNAKSVAIIGASGTSRKKLGNYILDSLAFHDYKGKVFPVNPKHESIMDLKSYQSILDIPDKVDLVVIAIPLKGVPGILDQCNKKDIHNVVIISGGGKEIGAKQLEERIKKLARDYDIRIIGCNCIGVFDGFSRLDTFFQTHERMKRPKKGNISMISQSGTVGVAFLEEMDEIGINKFVSYGNRIDVDEADLIEYFKNDPNTKVIAAYIEGLEKGRKFLEVAKKTTTEKPIIAYKAGRSPQASKASISHTGFLSGTFNVVSGIFSQAGIISVDSFEELVAASKAILMQPKSNGNRVLAITNGAGAIIQAIDRIEKKKKLKLAELSKSSKTKLNKILPNYVIIENPIDLTGSAIDQDYRTAIETAIEDQNVDIIMPWFVFQDTPISNKIHLVFSVLKRSSSKPIICGTIGGEYTHYMGRLFEEEGIPIFYSVNEWVTAAEAISTNV